MREIKFRGKSINGADMWVYGSLINNVFTKNADKSAIMYIFDHNFDCWEDIADRIGDFAVFTKSVGQFTGHKLNGVDLYEGDIIRVEEDAPDIDEEDKMNWYVVVFVQEWCMYAMLHTKNEYFQYLKNGKADLDEVLFWTFPITNTKDNPEKYFLCGNTYENPELLNR